MNTGTVTLISGIGQKSGKPYTALRLKAGKWTDLHFPTQFEKEYLAEELKDGKTGSFVFNPSTRKILITVGEEYFADHEVSSVFEQNYLEKYFRPVEPETKTPSELSEDDKIDLENEDTGNGLFD